ncbi:flagella basal body P-ring formation protein FlgA, partial [bacterium]|nr:flagella basal body P-ring formation protein FlgA [bacterium]
MNQRSNISFILLTLSLFAAAAPAADLTTVVNNSNARVAELTPVLTQLFNTIAGDSIKVTVQFTEPQQKIADLGKLPLEIILQQPRQLMPGRQVISLLCCDAAGHRAMQHLCVEAKLYGTVAIPVKMLKRGEKITAENIRIQEIELSSIHLRSAVLHPEHVIGMEVVRYLSADSPIRWDQVKPISLVQKGDG